METMPRRRQRRGITDSYMNPFDWFYKKGNRVSVEGESITIKIGGDKDDKLAQKQKYTNRIVSTKYTLLTFFPKNMFEQFRRIANFYFLCMTVIAIVIDSPVTPLTSLVPLVFVIAVTAAKQGYEDYLRHRADNMVNYSLVTVIRNGEELDMKCENIRQGDIVKVTRDCDVPCDLVLIKSEDPSGKVHITTANLDGETNLKTLSVPKGLPDLEVERLHTLGMIECENPQPDLYSFKGRVELSAIFGRTDITSDTQPESSNVLPLMAENLLLRGSRVKNTAWAIGCAVYTGQNTKLQQNSKKTKGKMSSSESFINKYLIFFLLILIGTVTASYFLKRYNDRYNDQHNYYMGEMDDTYQVSQFLQDYFSFLILFNYLIPISLYVTIEMAKFLGSFYLEWDFDLYDEETDQPCIVNTSDLNEELGQVQILFSDKTGTLTKNIMIFQQCSINGKMYRQIGKGLREKGRTYSLKIGECSNHVYKFFEALAVCHTVQVAGDYSVEEEEEEDESGDNRFFNFSNITEEDNEIVNVSTESETDETDHLAAVRYTQVPYLDTNLNHLNENGIGDAPRQSITSNGRPKSFVDSPTTPIVQAIPLNDLINGNPDNLTPTRVKSMDIRRAFSDSEETKTEILSHRRTQSYAASSATRSTNVLSSPPPVIRSNLTRTRSSGRSRASARESYAIESFTEASLLTKKESILSKSEEILTFIDKLDYQASSPDEKALVEVCARMGLVYVGEDNDIMNIRLKTRCVKKKADQVDSNKAEEQVKFKRLAVLEFTSDRKRMSTIVQDQTGQVWLYTKGAESHVLPLCTKTNKQFIATTQQHINEFAKEGLRTLAVARRKLTTAEYNHFNNEILQANNSLTDRAKQVEEVQRRVETGLELLGATAVEDALQDNVRDTLESLRKAGIKVWVLTGDKVETALNIALSCGHIPENAGKYFITECQTEAQVKAHLEAFSIEMNRSPFINFALLIDGMSLAIALVHYAEMFRDISIHCRAVLCCRLSPLQKSEVVQLMKTTEENPVTAAIGDGANDVSMIQEAHVGLGIVGKEGRQAARCADYAFANFSMIKKMMLVHGHYFSQRLALLVLYFFYKNLVFMAIQLYFQMSSMFSTQSVYDSMFLTLYNVVYTAFPILVIALTEKVYSEERLMTEPELYKENTGNSAFGWKYFVGWMLLAIYHSLVIYLFAFVIWENNPAILANPRTVNFWCLGTFLMHNLVVVVNLKLLIDAVYKNYVFIATVWLSIFAFMGSTFVYNLLNIHYDGDMLWVYNTLLASMTFWILSILIIIAALLPDFTLKVLKAWDIRLGRLFPGNELSNKYFKRNKIQTTYL